MFDDTYKYNSVDVAKYIVAYANANRTFINLTKVQKLLYICYGAYLVLGETRLVNEHPQAWPFGPVFPTTRRKLLNIELDDISFDNIGSVGQDGELEKIVKFVFDEFGRYSASSLTEWSHRPGSPWEKATQRRGFKWGDQMDDTEIRDYFDTIIVRDGRKQLG